MSNSPLNDVLEWSIGSLLRVMDRSEMVMTVMHPLLAGSKEDATPKPTPAPDSVDSMIAVARAAGWNVKDNRNG